MALRAVFFDIDDTLYETTRFAQLAREEAVDAMIERGLRVPAARVLEELYEVVAEFGSNDDQHFNRLLGRLPADSTLGVNPALLVTAGVIAYHETKWRELHIHEEAETLLRDLAATDIRLGVISAGKTAKQMEKLLRLHLDRLIDPALIFITDQQGIAKTNPKLYQRAVVRAGVEPADAMHVGDHPLHDVASAQSAGLKTTWHRGSGKHAPLAVGIEPDHVIAEVGELREILRSTYDVAV